MVREKVRVKVSVRVIVSIEIGITVKTRTRLFALGSREPRETSAGSASF